MSRRAMSKLAIRARAHVRRWQRNTKGVAAVEFAFIVPIMSVMFVGAVELSQAITVDRRVTQVASSTGDLLARWAPPPPPAKNGIPQTEIADIMKIGGFIMEPYSRAPLQIILRNIASSPTNATVTKQSWTCTYKGSGPGGTPTQTCTCTDTVHVIPPNLLTTLDSVVVAEVTYAYKPLVFDYFMKKSWGTSGSSGTYGLAQTVYLKPRSQAVNMLQTDNTPCPAATF